MRPALLVLTCLPWILVSCQEDKTYVTNNYGPVDWTPPVLTWLTPPDAEVRGTVGLDVAVTDSSEISRVYFFVNGFQMDSLSAPPYRFQLVTDSLLDGVHLVEARARDEFGNLGISPVLRINVANTPPPSPRLIWVPDDYERIQDAINAAAHHDTIRTQSGTYYEALNTFGKGLWIESLSGPLATTINSAESNSCFTVSSGSLTATVRGFILTGAETVVRYENGGLCNFYNCIFQSDTATSLWFSTYSGGDIRNNLFSGSQTAVQLGYHWGSFYNNILQFATGTALFNRAIARNPVVYGYNLFWGNAQDYSFFEPGEGDVYNNPMLDLGNGMLLPGSPAIDSGNPEILDRDSSRSDIGPFGGPWAY
jgi:hypothetical protein